MLDLAIACLIITITILLNARIYWLIKYQESDPLKVAKPWWIENQIDKDISDEFNKRG
jgi:hypothetical protein